MDRDATQIEQLASGHAIETQGLLAQITAMRGAWLREREASNRAIDDARDDRDAAREELDEAQKLIGEATSTINNQNERINELVSACLRDTNAGANINGALERHYQGVERRIDQLAANVEDDCANAVALELKAQLVALRTNVYLDDCPF